MRWIVEKPERWDRTSALLQPHQSMFWSHLAQPNWRWESPIDHDSRAYFHYCLQTMSQVLLRPLLTEVQGWRRQGQWLNVIAQRHNWTEKGVSKLAWSHQFFNLGWWSGGFELTTSHSADWHSSNWANWATVYSVPELSHNAPLSNDLKCQVCKKAYKRPTWNKTELECWQCENQRPSASHIAVTAPRPQ